MKSFFKSTLIGVFLGAGAILPGISSGVLCVIFGIYEKLVNSILGIFKDFKNSFSFLFPICLGGFIGVLLFANSLNLLFTKFPMQASFSFMGLIIGTIPSLIKLSNKSGFKLHYLIYSVATILFTLVLLQYESNFVLQNSELNHSCFYFILCGFLMSIGVVVPGVSNTVILMLLGVYSIYLESVSFLNLSVLIPMGIGLIIGCILWLKIIQYLLSNFYVPTFFSIIGFVIGSIFILYPGITFDFNGISSILLFFMCMYLSFKLERRA